MNYNEMTSRITNLDARVRILESKANGSTREQELKRSLLAENDAKHAAYDLLDAFDAAHNLILEAARQVGHGVVPDEFYDGFKALGDAHKRWKEWIR